MARPERIRLGDLLIQEALITAAQLDEALAEQKKNGRKLGRVCVDRHWVTEGLNAVEQLLSNDPRTGTFCHGETPGLADCCLVPQVHNARRYHCALGAMPTIARIVDTCEALDAFQRASPARQADAE